MRVDGSHQTRPHREKKGAPGSVSQWDRPGRRLLLRPFRQTGTPPPPAALPAAAETSPAPRRGRPTRSGALNGKHHKKRWPANSSGRPPRSNFRSGEPSRTHRRRAPLYTPRAPGFGAALISRKQKRAKAIGGPTSAAGRFETLQRCTERCQGGWGDTMSGLNTSTHTAGAIAIIIVIINLFPAMVRWN